MAFTFHFLDFEEYPSLSRSTHRSCTYDNLPRYNYSTSETKMCDSVKDLKRTNLLSLLATFAHEESLFFEILLEEDDGKDLEEPMKKSRRIYDRPDYKKSLWWTMLEKGDCKDPSNRQFMVFRRRFGIPFNLFKVVVERARAWSLNDGKSKLGDES